MEAGPKKVQRQLVPRWREIARTRPAELRSIREFSVDEASRRRSRQELHVREAHERWLKSASLENANELVAAAFTTPLEPLAAGAVSQILAPESNATPALRRLAQKLRTGGRISANNFIEGEFESGNELKIAQVRLSGIKGQLAIYPRNALLYVEKARVHSAIGQDKKAQDAMRVAMALAPTNRYVLRAASRLYVHANNADVAHTILKRNTATAYDPWLMSAELALSSVADKPSKFAKDARRLISDRTFAPLHTSELAAALGTLEMFNGAAKNAKRLFRHSLQDPTDNSVAQVRWAAPMLNMPFPLVYLLVDGSFEASAEAANASGAPAGEVIRHTQDWWEDEPFSSRPLWLGSYTAAARMRDYALALRFCDLGLRVHSNDPILTNNRALALSKLGRASDALDVIERIREHGPEFSPIIRATEGLIQFRIGNSALGHRLYFEAIERADKMGDKSIGLRAKSYLLEERILAGELVTQNEINQLDADVGKVKDKLLTVFWMEQKVQLEELAQSPRTIRSP